ncbi:outer membrane lipoprotein-sorting protein [Roseibacillus ishigakijimensis]|uniref:Outer membrane lipoprotein-sorting protein n=1 Tax=Roseibacillus ishigakijimensis TaxID=454146 RepID=A0A934RKU1_9BACT|nr:outer membrane lipoprotein-sorting protein [Roseibacillus ishigakijimensis]MBK1832688.1 outer membrane lipoprotein-sorting protein [Roseibacillus ishigakijimensis]
MKTTLLTTVLFLLSMLGLQAQLPAADDILRTARYVATLQDTSLRGTLQKNGRPGEVPIALFLHENEGVEFQVYDNKVWNKFQLKLADNEYDLFEGVGNKIRRFDKKKITAPVMGTDLTYEDLAMSFLYWPNGETLGEENLGVGRDAWKVRLVNPKAVGRYKTVDVWVHKKSGALMQINGYRADGKCIKVFKVTEIMRVGGGEYSIKTMKVQSYGEDGRTTGITSLEFEKPKATAPTGLR